VAIVKCNTLVRFLRLRACFFSLAAKYLNIAGGGSKAGAAGGGI